MAVRLLATRDSGILTDEALDFLAELTRNHRPRLEELLRRREAVQARYDAGEKPRFLPETVHVRESNYKVAPLPKDLLDRRVEITGPVDRKMVINALNSGSSVFMADFEDSNAPTWHNQIDGQRNLRDAVRRTISFTDPKSGKSYKLKSKTAALMVRPRGWHLPEKHVLVDGKPVPGAIFDFALYFFHNARELLARGSGPYFYLPKMQSHLEARLWNAVFLDAQALLGIPRGTIKATVLIETLPAAFEMDEILYELREHSAGLNCGRWDMIFSYIKTLRKDPAWVMPDRGVITMEQPCMRSYSLLLIKTCHRRGVHAMGGMAAQIPIKNDPQANEAALVKVRADKQREVRDGHDGTWVAHPALVTVALEVFNAGMPAPNQIGKARDDVQVGEADLLTVPKGPRTEACLRHNCVVGVQYLEAWLGGLGCVPLYNLMEDAATAEICRTQVWQWLRHKARLDDGQVLTADAFGRMLDEEMGHLKGQLGAERWARGHFPEAIRLFREFSTSATLAPFLTLPAYERLHETPMAKLPLHARSRHAAPTAVTCSAVVTDNAVPEGHKGLHGFLYGEKGADVHDNAEQQYVLREGEDDGTTLVGVDSFVAEREGERLTGVYALYDARRSLQYVGYARSIVLAIKAHRGRVGEERCALVRAMVFANKSMASRGHLVEQARRWLDKAGTTPPGNGVERELWEGATMVAAMSAAEREEHEGRALKLRKAMGENLGDDVEGEEPSARERRLNLIRAVEGDDWSSVVDGQTTETVAPELVEAQLRAARNPIATPFAHASVHRSIGNSAEAPAPMTPEAVEKALDEVRPYLIADGGNVEVVGIDSGVVMLRLQGACGTCPSSAGTMKMGIERSLKAAFGGALKGVEQVDSVETSATAAAVDAHLDMLRPAITSYGATVQVLGVEGDECRVRFDGPPPIGMGVKAAIKDKFPDIRTVTLVAS
ncbi:hypothetical protein WJX81_006415 [Elliptochloris bilobata]|uniref:malate synthase n=1 Tax=Elliptochloris bilobata TaxID=381761 RepID=A0AAW1RHZ3_9CHLO